MKNTSKLISILFALVLALTMTIPALATVTSPEVTAKAGETVTVEFKYENIKAFGGTLEFSNEALFAEVNVACPVLAADGNGGFIYNELNKRVAGYATKPVSPVLTITVKIADDAQVGDTCDITFVYEASGDGYFSSDSNYASETVTVKVVGDEPIDIDYSRLEAQIARAEALDESEYTADSWAAMKDAYDEAVAALNSLSQDEVDRAADKLSDAIDALEKLSGEPNPPTNDRVLALCGVVMASGLVLAGAFIFTKKKQQIG